MLTTTNSVNKLFCYNMISYSQGNRFRRLRLFQSFQVVFFQFFLKVQFLLHSRRSFGMYSKQGSIYNKLFYANFQFVAFLTLDFCPPFLWCDMYVRYRLLLILQTLGLAVLL